MNKETKVGIFVVVCIGLIIAFSSFTGNMHLFGKSGANVTFHISTASGLVVSSKVKYLGLDVGKVKSIGLQDGVVVVTAAINHDKHIPNNIIVTLATEGLMGEMFVELRPDSKTTATGFIKEGDVFDNFVMPTTMEDLAKKVGDIAERVNELLSHNQQNINEIITHLNNSLGIINNMLQKREKDIDGIIVNIHAASISMKQLTERLEGMLSSEEGNIKTSLANVKEITDKAKISIDNINKITTDAHEGKGTIGMLLTDDETRDNLKSAISGINNMVDRAERLVLQLEGDIEYLTRHDSYQGSFSGKLIPADTHYYYFGIGSRAFGTTTRTVTKFDYVDHLDPNNNSSYTETKEQTTENALMFTLQYALMFDRLLGVRGGLLDSRVGFGADLYPFRNDDLIFTFEASDFFRDYGTHMKIKAKYAFLKNVFVQAGWDEVGNDRNSFYIGGGIRVWDNDLKYVIGSVPVPGL